MLPDAREAVKKKINEKIAERRQKSQEEKIYNVLNDIQQDLDLETDIYNEENLEENVNWLPDAQEGEALSDLKNPFSNFDEREINDSEDKLQRLEAELAKLKAQQGKRMTSQTCVLESHPLKKHRANNPFQDPDDEEAYANVSALYGDETLEELERRVAAGSEL